MSQPGEPSAFHFAAPLWLDEVDSTNNELKRRLGAGGLQAGTVIAARRQTKGRGRLGNEWHSSAGAGLTFSFLWTGRMELDTVGTLPMACALGVRDCLLDFGVDSRCKWPNDVMTDRGKICGILTESSPGPGGMVCLVVGIGINVRSDSGREERIAQPAACLAQFIPDPPLPDALLPGALTRLGVRIGMWQRSGFSGIRHDLDACLWGRGRTVAVRTGGTTVNGAICGLGEKGELQLRDANDRIISVISASALDFAP